MEQMKWWPEGTRVHLEWNLIIPPGKDPAEVVRKIEEAAKAAFQSETTEVL